MRIDTNAHLLQVKISEQKRIWILAKQLIKADKTMTIKSSEEIYNVTESGVTIPKQFLGGVEKVLVRKEKDVIVVVLLQKDDPIFQLGKHPITMGISNASTNHDDYLYGRSE